MSELIPAFEFRRVFVEPWTVDASLTIWIVVMGFLVTATCGWVGQFLMLRRMALMGDAISHSVLPGLASVFLFVSFWTGSHPKNAHAGRDSTTMFIGALLAGILTTVLVEFLHRRSRIKQDAAIGIVFSSLFALGVVLITLFADHVDLDADCVLFGEIGFVPLQNFVHWAGRELAPVPVARMGGVALLTGVLLVAFYKELLVSSFDAGLATSLGVNATAVHYLLMGWLSLVIVCAFESVGGILVVAMLILPGATASLLSTRLPRIFLLIVGQSAVSTVLGVHLATWLDCSTAGAMVVAGSGLFCLAWAGHVGRRWYLRRAAARTPAEADSEFSPASPPSRG